MESALNVYSEIGQLRKVMLHRPGAEIENIIPEYMESLLFDDIPYLKIAQQEHDIFAETLKKCGATPLYLEDLCADILSDGNLRDEFLEQFLREGGIYHNNRQQMMFEYFSDIKSPRKLVDKLITGVYKKEVPNFKAENLQDRVRKDYPFLLAPLPNMYFTRDNFAVLGQGVSINKMQTKTRDRESIFGEYIFRYHPEYKHVKKYYTRNLPHSLEGGDILILNDNIIAIGISERTMPSAIERFAENIFFNSEESFTTILAFNLPKKRAYMHLDTVFTMVDRDKFTIHPGIHKPLEVFSIVKGTHKNLVITEEVDVLENVLKKYLDIDSVQLIECGGGDFVSAGREQWNDGSNTLAVSPGNVIVYERNYVTNAHLQEAGVKTHIIPSSELSRGRGGPRCMSMPFGRDKL